MGSCVLFIAHQKWLFGLTRVQIYDIRINEGPLYSKACLISLTCIARPLNSLHSQLYRSHLRGYVRTACNQATSQFLCPKGHYDMLHCMNFPHSVLYTCEDTLHKLTVFTSLPHTYFSGGKDKATHQTSYLFLSSVEVDRVLESPELTP